MENLNCKIYEEENNGSWNLKVEHENVNTITASGGNLIFCMILPPFDLTDTL